MAIAMAMATTTATATATAIATANNIFYKMKNDLTTPTWQFNI